MTAYYGTFYFLLCSVLLSLGTASALEQHTIDKQNVPAIRKWNWKDSRSASHLTTITTKTTTTTKNDYVCIRNQKHFSWMFVCASCVCVCVSSNANTDKWLNVLCAYTLDGLYMYNIYEICGGGANGGINRTTGADWKCWCVCDGGNNALRTLHLINSISFRTLLLLQAKPKRQIICSVDLCFEPFRYACLHVARRPAGRQAGWLTFAVKPTAVRNRYTHHIVLCAQYIYISQVLRASKRVCVQDGEWYMHGQHTLLLV